MGVPGSTRRARPSLRERRAACWSTGLPSHSAAWCVTRDQDGKGDQENDGERDLRAEHPRTGSDVRNALAGWVIAMSLLRMSGPCGRRQAAAGLLVQPLFAILNCAIMQFGDLRLISDSLVTLKRGQGKFSSSGREHGCSSQRQRRRPRNCAGERGAWLKELRGRAGLSQLQLAERLNLKYYTFVSQVENGFGRVPTESMEAWARALGGRARRPSRAGCCRSTIRSSIGCCSR